MANDAPDAVDAYVFLRAHHRGRHCDRELDTAIDLGLNLAFKKKPIGRDIFGDGVKLSLGCLQDQGKANGKAYGRPDWIFGAYLFNLCHGIDSCLETLQAESCLCQLESIAQVINTEEFSVGVFWLQTPVLRGYVGDSPSRDGLAGITLRLWAFSGILRCWVLQPRRPVRQVSVRTTRPIYQCLRGFACVNDPFGARWSA